MSKPGRRRWRAITDDDVRAAVARHHYAIDVLREFGFPASACSYEALKLRIRRLGLDTSHWLRYRLPPRAPRRRPLDVVLVPGGYARETNRARIKRRLISEGVLVELCAVCGLGPSWHGKPLVLRLDHVNGEKHDWRRENLRLVCPNCDSQLPTHCGRNVKRHSQTALH